VVGYSFLKPRLLEPRLVHPHGVEEFVRESVVDIGTPAEILFWVDIDLSLAGITACGPL